MTFLSPFLFCLAVASILGALWLFAPEAALQATSSVGGSAAVGISGGISGELPPRRGVHWDRFPYKTCAWEKNGKIYEKMEIRKWKDWVPDKSRWGGHEYAKTIRGQNDAENATRLLQETCVAELIHWVLMLATPLVFVFAHGPMAVLVVLLYGFSHIPCIIIQRYNRPRLCALLRRCQRKGAETT